jgi:hypothetical protein
MALAASTKLNRVRDIETFGGLATAVAALVPSVSGVAWTRQQKFNSLPDHFTVTTMAQHYEATYAGSLPSASGITAGMKLNSTRDGITLAHVVKFIKDQDVDIAVPTNSVAPVISGTGNGPFTSTTGTWANADRYTYQWYRGAVAVSGATTNTLAANAANVGQSITCRVAGVNEAGTATPVASNAILGA